MDFKEKTTDRTKIKIPYINAFVQRGKQNKLLKDYIDSHMHKSPLIPNKKNEAGRLNTPLNTQNYYFKSPIPQRRLKDDEFLHNRNKSMHK